MYNTYFRDSILNINMQDYLARQNGLTPEVKEAAEPEKLKTQRTADEKKQEDIKKRIEYLEKKQNIIKNYSDPKDYTHVATESGNVYVYTDYYNKYINGELSNKLEKTLADNIHDADMFGRLGLPIFVLPETFYFSNEVYGGKIPDSIMQGILLEFKNLTTEKWSQFQNQLSDAMDKADIAYIEMQQDGVINNNYKRTLYDAIRFQISNNLKYNNKFVVTSVNGEDIHAYEIISGTLNEVPLARLGEVSKPNTNIASIDEEVNSLKAQSVATSLPHIESRAVDTSRYTSSFMFDTTKGQYYIDAKNAYNELVEVLSAAQGESPNMAEIRKNAQLGAIFLSSLSEDLQDTFVRKSISIQHQKIKTLKTTDSTLSASNNPHYKRLG